MCYVLCDMCVAQNLTWLLPERYSGNEVAVETVCSVVGLISLYHEHILNETSDTKLNGGGEKAVAMSKRRAGDKRHEKDDRTDDDDDGENHKDETGEEEASSSKKNKATKRRAIPWPMLLAVVQQVEVLGEVVAAAKDKAADETTVKMLGGGAGIDAVLESAVFVPSSSKALAISVIELVKACFRCCQLARGEGNVLIDGASFDTDRTDSVGADAGKIGAARLAMGLRVDDLAGAGAGAGDSRRKSAQRAMAQLRNRLRAESDAKERAETSLGDTRSASTASGLSELDGARGGGESLVRSPSSASSGMGDGEDAGCKSGGAAGGGFVDPPWWFQKQPQTYDLADGNDADDDEADVDDDRAHARKGDAPGSLLRDDARARRCPSLHPSLRPGRMPPQVRACVCVCVRVCVCVASTPPIPLYRERMHVCSRSYMSCLKTWYNADNTLPSSCVHRPCAFLVSRVCMYMIGWVLVRNLIIMTGGTCCDVFRRWRVTVHCATGRVCGAFVFLQSPKSSRGRCRGQ